jgi:O-antigen ligase
MVLTRRNLDWWCERGILTLVLAALVFAPLAFGAIQAWSFLVVQALVAGVLGLWTVRWWGGHKPKLLWPPLAWAVAAFVAYAVARYFTADIEYVARLELIQVLLFAFVFFAVVNHLHGQDETMAVTWTLLILGTVVSGYAIAQYFNHSDQVWNVVRPLPTPGRASGTFFSPDKLAAFLEMLLPLALAVLVAGRVSVVTRILLAYASLTMMAGLAVTFSRAGWVAAAAGVFLLLGFLLCHQNYRGRAGGLLLLLLAGGGFSVWHYLSRSISYGRRVTGDPGGPGVLDWTNRFDMWRAALRMWRDHFWWGVGPAHYDSCFGEYRPESFQGRPLWAHNDYVNLLADWGTVGGMIVFGGVVIFIFGLWKTWPHVRRAENTFGTGQSNRFAFYLGAVCGLFALAVHSTADFNVHTPANALVGVTLLALVASNVRFATERHWLRVRLPLKLACSLVLVGGVTCFVFQGWRRGEEALWLAQAERLPDFSPGHMEALKKALACEPQNFQTAYDLGECYRTQSLDGGTNYVELAHTALNFYAQASRLNPHDPYSRLRSGMCLDWLGRHAEAEPFYYAAETHDPNGNYVVANIGWHFVQTGDYSAARQWFGRAIKLAGGAQNRMASYYYAEVCEPKLTEAASSQQPLRLLYPGRDK